MEIKLNVDYPVTIDIKDKKYLIGIDYNPILERNYITGETEIRGARNTIRVLHAFRGEEIDEIMEMVEESNGIVLVDIDGVRGEFSIEYSFSETLGGERELYDLKFIDIK